MKKNGKCPKCESEELRHFDQAASGSFGQLAIKRGYFTDTGILEVYVCNACGYVEFYAKDIPLDD